MLSYQIIVMRSLQHVMRRLGFNVNGVKTFSTWEPGRQAKAGRPSKYFDNNDSEEEMEEPRGAQGPPKSHSNKSASPEALQDFSDLSHSFAGERPTEPVVEARSASHKFDVALTLLMKALAGDGAVPMPEYRRAMSSYPELHTVVPCLVDPRKPEHGVIVDSASLRTHLQNLTEEIVTEQGHEEKNTKPLHGTEAETIGSLQGAAGQEALENSKQTQSNVVQSKVAICPPSNPPRRAPMRRASFFIRRVKFNTSKPRRDNPDNDPRLEWTEVCPCSDCVAWGEKRLSTRSEVLDMKEQLLVHGIDITYWGRDGQKSVWDLVWEQKQGHIQLKVNESTGKYTRYTRQLSIKLCAKTLNKGDCMLMEVAETTGCEGKFQNEDKFITKRMALGVNWSEECKRVLEADLGLSPDWQKRNLHLVEHRTFEDPQPAWRYPGLFSCYMIDEAHFLIDDPKSKDVLGLPHGSDFATVTFSKQHGTEKQQHWQWKAQPFTAQILQRKNVAMRAEIRRRSSKGRNSDEYTLSGRRTSVQAMLDKKAARRTFAGGDEGDNRKVAFTQGDRQSQNAGNDSHRFQISKNRAKISGKEENPEAPGASQEPLVPRPLQMTGVLKGVSTPSTSARSPSPAARGSPSPDTEQPRRRSVGFSKGNDESPERGSPNNAKLSGKRNLSPDGAPPMGSSNNTSPEASTPSRRLQLTPPNRKAAPAAIKSFDASGHLGLIQME